MGRRCKAPWRGLIDMRRPRDGAISASSVDGEATTVPAIEVPPSDAAGFCNLRRGSASFDRASRFLEALESGVACCGTGRWLVNAQPVACPAASDGYCRPMVRLPQPACSAHGVMAIPAMARASPSALVAKGPPPRLRHERDIRDLKSSQSEPRVSRQCALLSGGCTTGTKTLPWHHTVKASGPRNGRSASRRRRCLQGRSECRRLPLHGLTLRSATIASSSILDAGGGTEEDRRWNRGKPASQSICGASHAWASIAHSLLV